MKALIIIDMQNDYYDEKLLDIIPKINMIRSDYDIVIFSINWHPNNKKYCIENTYGAQIIDGLIINKNDVIIKKGHMNHIILTQYFMMQEK